MRRLTRFFARLYPSEWRARYGEEFATLIDDTPFRWSTDFDLLKGAIFMQLRVRNFPRLALLLSIVGLLVGFGTSYVVTPRYISEARLAFQSDATEEPVTTRMMGLQNGILSRYSLSSLMQDPRLDLYATDREHEPLEDVIETMRSNIRIETTLTDAHYQPFTIRFAYANPEKAQETVQALVTRFTDNNEELRRQAQLPLETQTEADKRVLQLEARVALLERRLGVSSDVEALSDRPLRRGGILLEVIDSTSLPTSPAWPNRSVFAATGFAAGFALTLVVWILRRPAGLSPEAA